MGWWDSESKQQACHLEERCADSEVRRAGVATCCTGALLGVAWQRRDIEISILKSRVAAGRERLSGQGCACQRPQGKGGGRRARARECGEEGDGCHGCSQCCAGKALVLARAKWHARIKHWVSVWRARTTPPHPGRKLVYAHQPSLSIIVVSALAATDEFKTRQCTEI